VLDGDARRGEITGFTGIDDPYEAPEHPELTLDTVVTTPEDNARRVLAHLERAGFVRERSGDIVLSAVGAGPGLLALEHASHSPCYRPSQAGSGSMAKNSRYGRKCWSSEAPSSPNAFRS
jgi:hypothetical protein